MRQALEVWNEERLEKHMLQSGVKWHFNTPAASHHGGVWERCIRSFRSILRHLLHEQVVTDEVLQTVFAEVEFILNNRPLTEFSNDPVDLRPLTPNDILLHRPCPSLPPGIFHKDDMILKRKWRQSQYLADVFWRRWLREYVPTLQTRQKWATVRRNFRKGDLVLLVDDNCARGDWKMGRVVDVYTAQDGLVRSVQVKTATSLLSRPVTKLCLLEHALLE